MISLDPPPTSMTASGPSNGVAREREAPRKEKWPSSSPDRTRSCRPVAFSTASHSSLEFFASRIAAVPTIATSSAPSSCA
jgi:hypothetical protein